jgi:hypothetical protein
MPYLNTITLKKYEVTYLEGRAMAQDVTRQLLKAEVRVHARVSQCGFCGRQSGTGTDFSSSPSGFPCQYHSTVAHHTHMSSRTGVLKLFS